jgi:hypothetical protein
MPRGNEQIRIRFAAILSIFTVVLIGVCSAGEKRELRFPRGSTSTTIEGGVIRGERDLYFLTANATQTMEMNISPLEGNAVFEIYKPGYTVSERDGFIEIDGESLPEAGETNDAKVWKGVLPVSGKYLN